MSEATRPDARLLPVAVVSWAAMWLATAGLAPPGVSLGLALAAAIAVALWLVRHGRWLAVTAVMSAAGVFTVGALRTDALTVGDISQLGDQHAWVSAEVVLITDPVLYNNRPQRGAFAVAQVRLELVEGRGSVIRAGVPVRVRATGESAMALTKASPGARLQINGIAGRPEVGEPFALTIALRAPPELLAQPNAVDAGVNALRSGLRAAMQASPGPQAALVPSLVVGDTSMITDEISDQFRSTALTHLLAVSGANLTLMLGFLLTVVKWVGVRGRWVRVFAVFGVVGFVLLCRGEPSVLRAAAMGIVALAALGAGRDRAKGFRHLFVAVIVLVLIDPYLARSWGFALSVAATSGILFWATRWQEAMRAWAPGWVAEAICIPLAAQLATQPLITAFSGQISVVGLLANALAGPFVGPTTMLGLLAGLASVIAGWIALPIGWLAGWSAQPILWIAKIGAGLPAAAWSVGADPLRLVILAVACLALAVCVSAVVRSAGRTAGLVVLLLVLANWQPRPAGWPGEWSVAFCDVGQGDATVIRAGPKDAVVVDVGPEAKPTIDCLRALGVSRIPLLVLTHYHSDHVGGLVEVLKQFPTALVLVTQLSSPKLVAGSVAEEVARRGVTLRVSPPGERITVGEVYWTTVYAGEATARVEASTFTESAVENDSSVIGIVEVRHLRVLLPGDSEPAGQAAALKVADELGIDLRADILKLPHHGSSRQHEAFFQRSAASIAIASAGKDNDYSHPAPSTVRLAQRLGMRVFTTAQTGSIAIGRKDEGLAVRTVTNGQ